MLNKVIGTRKQATQYEIGHFYHITGGNLSYLVYVKTNNYEGINAEVIATDGPAYQANMLDSFCSMDLSQNPNINLIREIPDKDLPLFLGWSIRWLSFEKHLKRLVR